MEEVFPYEATSHDSTCLCRTFEHKSTVVRLKDHILCRLIDEVLTLNLFFVLVANFTDSRHSLNYCRFLMLHLIAFSAPFVSVRSVLLARI
jgi:hypothetical protein